MQVLRVLVQMQMARPAGLLWSSTFKKSHFSNLFSRK
jgi:hypothetical protein